MIKALIIDDELHCVESLNMLLSEYCPQVQVVGKCASAKQAMQAISKNIPDLIFLDIEMPVMNGFQLLEQFPAVPFSIIFTTSYDQYAIKAIRSSALDYLLKPIDVKELTSAVKKVENQKQFPLTEQFTMLIENFQGKSDRFRKLAVPTVEGYELIPAEEIIRCEANDNYTYLFVRGKPRIIACRTLKEIQEQLQHFQVFVRIHHSALINLNEIVRYVRGEGGYVIMSDGASVNVSRRKKEELMKWM